MYVGEKNPVTLMASLNCSGGNKIDTAVTFSSMLWKTEALLDVKHRKPQHNTNKIQTHLDEEILPIR